MQYSMSPRAPQALQDFGGRGYDLARFKTAASGSDWTQAFQNALVQCVGSSAPLLIDSGMYNVALDQVVIDGALSGGARFCPPIIGNGMVATTIKGTGTAATTTIAAGSNGASLPQATINVASVTGFATAGVLLVTTASGVQVVSYTGQSGSAFTGCSGGVGAMATGGAVQAPGAVLTVGATPANNYRMSHLQGFTIDGGGVLGTGTTITTPGASAGILYTDGCARVSARDVNVQFCLGTLGAGIMNSAGMWSSTFANCYAQNNKTGGRFVRNCQDTALANCRFQANLNVQLDVGDGSRSVGPIYLHGCQMQQAAGLTNALASNIRILGGHVVIYGYYGECNDGNDRTDIRVLTSSFESIIEAHGVYSVANGSGAYWLTLPADDTSWVYVDAGVLNISGYVGNYYANKNQLRKILNIWTPDETNPIRSHEFYGGPAVFNAPTAQTAPVVEIRKNGTLWTQVDAAGRIGGAAHAVTNVTSGTSPYAVSQHDSVITADTSGGNVTVTLPDASVRSGQYVEVIRTPSAANTLTVGSAGGTINGSATDTSLTTVNAVGRYRAVASNWIKV